MTVDEMAQQASRYYAARLEEHGPTPRGVDWNSAESQQTRFRALLTVVSEPGTPFSLTDYGCGYGALYDWIVGRGLPCTYRGFDACPSMIAAARGLRAENERCRFVGSEADLLPADYSVASGLFNVKLAAGEAEWEACVFETLGRMWAVSTKGMSFNALTTYSDADRRRPDLFYADPRRFFDECARRFSRHLAVLHDYRLYDFTVVVRR